MKDFIVNDVSRETYEKFVIYKELLIKWQKAINLVSRETLDDFYNRHLLDSLQLANYINETKILDVGSGGGFPGMVLAIYNDNYEVTCIDSDSRKMVFLEEVARRTSTKVNIITKRIEEFKQNDFDVLCARGFSSLSNLIELTKKHTKCGRGVFLKGKKIEEEVREAKQKLCFRYNIFESVTDKTGRIVVVDAL